MTHSYILPIQIPNLTHTHTHTVNIHILFYLKFGGAAWFDMMGVEIWLESTLLPEKDGVADMDADMEAEIRSALLPGQSARDADRDRMCRDDREGEDIGLRGLEGRVRQFNASAGSPLGQVEDAAARS